MNADDKVIYCRGQNDNDSDIWDDTVLIKAYDTAVNSLKMKLGEKTDSKQQQQGKKRNKSKKKKNKKKDNTPGQWKVGNRCLATYSEDGLQYEAVIKSIDQSADTCVVTYIGYGNQEEVPLCELMHPNDAKLASLLNDVQSELDSMEWNSTVSSPSGCHYNQKNKSQRRRNLSDFGFPNVPFAPPMFGDSFPSFHSSMPMLGVPDLPPPPFIGDESALINDSEALHSMLISWYMAGYHTGYFQGSRFRQRRSSTSESCGKTEQQCQNDKDG